MALTVQRVEYTQGDVYEGEWSADGKRNGKGRLKMATGAEYAGEFMNGFFHGSGVLRFRLTTYLTIYCLNQLGSMEQCN